MVKYVLGLPVRRHGDGFAEPGAIRDMVGRAEELGFWGVTAPDHIVAPSAWARAGGGEQWFDPFVLLSFLAATTSSMRLIAHVIVLPYRSPFAVAKAVASLDRLSGGRAVLGAGSGYLKEEFDILGVPFEDRGERTDEALRAIVACWAEDRPEFHGRFFAIRDAAVAPRPLQEPRPPIWIGGNSMRAVRRAVELGECWTPFVAEPDDIRRGLDRAASLEGTIEVAAPLGRIEPEGGEDVVRSAREYEAAGAAYLKCGFGGGTPQEWTASLDWFAAAVGLD
ncbi:MAG: TIGR03619 family F420-dependent LLM class oxidoreductase [Actinomycetota bacterium]